MSSPRRDRGTPPLAPPRAVLRRYGLDVGGWTVSETTTGHINRSWFLQHPRQRLQYVLQWVNPRVFPRPLAVMRNLQAVTAHLWQAQLSRGIAAPERRCLQLVPTLDGERWVVHGRAEDGIGETPSEGPPAHDGANVYRLLVRIPDAKTYERASSPTTALTAAAAFGEFQRLLGDFNPATLEITIERFHDTPFRFQQLRRALDRAPRERVDAAATTIADGFELEPLASRLVDSGLRLRAVHNDAKLSNVLFDCQSDQALCVIDLDTVMPGLAAYDFGDLVRSMSHRAAEDIAAPETMQVDLELFSAVAAGYLGEARFFLDPDELDSLFDGATTIALQLGVRFLSDYLQGDVYFRVQRPDHNLDRARAQLHLVRSLRAQEKALREVVHRHARR